MSVLDQIERRPFPTLPARWLEVPVSMSFRPGTSPRFDPRPREWSEARWLIERTRDRRPLWRQIAEWIPAAPPGREPFHGIDRSADHWRLAGHPLQGCSGDSLEQRIQDAGLLIGRLASCDEATAVLPVKFDKVLVSTPGGRVHVETADVPRGFIISPWTWSIYEWTDGERQYQTAVCHLPAANATFEVT